MKKICLIMICLSLYLFGCQDSSSSFNSQVITISIDDAIHKLEKKDSFLLLLTRSKCTYCKELLDVIDQTKQDHSVTIYHVILRDEDTESFNEDVEKLKPYLHRPDQIPHYYYISQGEVVDAQMGYTSANPYRFWDWVAKNSLEGIK